ncbi:MAG TPA: serine protease [Polyangiaceae bacterium]
MRLRFSVAPLATALLVLLGCSSSQSNAVSLPAFHDPADAPAPIRKASQAIVRVATVGSEATGAFISDGGRLLTNNHVLGVDVCPSEGCYARLTINQQRGEPNADPVTVFVVPTAVDVGLDMAVVQVYASQGGAPFQPPAYLTIASHDASSLVGTHVTVVGHPEGHLKKWTSGEAYLFQGNWVWTTAYTLPGDSGSPILDDQGELVGIIHRGPTSEDLYSSEGVDTYSIGTASAPLLAAMSAALPATMISTAATTTPDDAVAHDILYLNAHVPSVTTAAGETDILTLLGTACDAGLARHDFRSPEDLGDALTPCTEALSWIECRGELSPQSPGTVCPADTAAWSARFNGVYEAWRALNGELALTPVSFGVASLQPTQDAGKSAASASLLAALSEAGNPLMPAFANDLAAFGVGSYAGKNIEAYIAGYRSVPAYAESGSSIASAALWMLDNGMMTRDQALTTLNGLYSDPTVELATKLYIEDMEHAGCVLP